MNMVAVLSISLANRENALEKGYDIENQRYKYVMFIGY